jgi:DNA-binding protein WhiA
VSFADQIRRELAEMPLKKNCCRRAFLAGLLVGAKISDGKNISLRLGNSEAVEQMQEPLRVLFGKQAEVDCVGSCGHFYWEVRFSSLPCAKMLTLLREGTQEAFEGALRASCDACRLHFLRGAFLAYGTVNDPHKYFHLEFILPEAIGEEALSFYLGDCGYPPRRIERSRGAGLYYKDSGAIEDLITMMGAHHMIFEVINSRIEREIRNNENRATNCVAKNIEKSISAATRQMEAIDRLMATGKLVSLPESLRTTAELRYRNPDATLDELTAMHSSAISKSGLNHRLQRLIDAAKDL